MKKIGASNTSYRGNTGSYSKRVDKNEMGKPSFFSMLGLDRKEITNLDSIDYTSMDLEELLDNIHETGEALKALPTLENIESYKVSISTFLKFVVKTSLKIETTAGSDFNPLKKQKKYTIIRVIDGKLEHLAAGVLQNQSDKLYILEKIEEINGLIVNLLT